MIREKLVNLSQRIGLYQQAVKIDTALRNRRLKRDFRRHGLEALVQADRALRSAGSFVFLDFGTLLGAYRDKAFIPYDFDLDVGILCEKRPDNLPEDIPSVTPSSALGRVNVAASDTSSPEGEGSSGSSLDLNEMLQNYIAEIPDEQASVIGTALFAVAAATIGLTSLMWAIMAVIALIKLFCPNKRFTMWYVKLLCWLPCVLFVLAPFFALTLAPQLLAGTVTGEAAEILTLATQIPMSFGGSGIVSGICLAVLWLISIFWFFPIKHKIRKIKNSMDN